MITPHQTLSDSHVLPHPTLTKPCGGRFYDYFHFTERKQRLRAGKESPQVEWLAGRRLRPGPGRQRLRSGIWVRCEEGVKGKR